MSDNKVVFGVEFDPTAWVDGVEVAIKSNDKFESSMQGISTSANDVKFDKSISELVKFQANVHNLLKSVQKDTGTSDKEIDLFVKNIVKSKSQITDFLNEFKAQIKKTNDPEALKGLQESIKITEGALKELSSQTDKNGQTNISAKAKLRLLREELIKLEDAGLDGTKTFKDLTIQSAKLTDQIGDQAQTIRTLASDTYKLDAGVDIVKQVAASYQLAEGALQLFGGSTDEVQVQMQKLIAVQSVMNGLQEISTFITGQSSGALAIKAGWNTAVTTTEEVLSLAIGTSTTATKAFSTALVATGIGAFVVGLGLLIAYWDDVSVALGGATVAQKAYEKAIEDSNSALQDAYVALDNQKLIFDSVKNGSLSAKKGLEQFNETIKDTGYAFDDINKAEAFYKANTKNFLAAALARATALNLINQAALLQAKSQSSNDVSILDDFSSTITYMFNKSDGEKQYKEQIAKRKAEDKKAANELLNLASINFGEANKLDSIIENSAKDFGAKSSEKGTKEKQYNQDKTKKERQKKEIENIYADLLAGFQKDLEKINGINLNGLELINVKANEAEKERQKKVSDALKDGKITSGQEKKLREKIGLIKDAEIQEETKKFNEARIKALKEINKSFDDVLEEDAMAKVQNMVNGYDKEIALINEQEQAKNKAFEEARTKHVNDVKEQIKQGYLTEEAGFIKIAELNFVYDDMVLQNKIKTTEELHQASLKHLKDLEADLEAENDLLIAYQNQAESAEILAQKQLYEKGLISLSKFNEEKEKINKKFADNERLIKIEELKKQIAEQEKLLNTTNGKGDEKAQQEAGKKLADLNTQLNNLLADSIKEKRVKTFYELFFEETEEGRKKAKSVSELVNQSVTSAIDIIKQRNQAELDSYDKAISLQEKRVTDANKIAENGNVEYLQQEQDRLNDLEAKREASARKQLQFDQAVQASQILVAVAGAAAQIAKGGTAEVIAGITTVIGALATGYQLVSQNSSNYPSFFDGVESLQLGNNPKGRDTIKANLNEGERVVPTYINEQLKGIKNKDLPMLVSDGIKYKRMNILDFEQPKKSSESELRLQNLENLQRENNEYLKRLAINVSLDENGFSASLESYLENRKKSSFA
jgi:hypothetical protein